LYFSLLFGWNKDFAAVVGNFLAHGIAVVALVAEQLLKVTTHFLHQR
jgi:hypothetical protein